MQSHCAKLGLWLMLCLVTSFLWMIGCAVFASITSPWLNQDIPSRERESEHITFDSDGMPIITGIDPFPSVRQRIYRNLDGELLDFPETKLPTFAKFTVLDLPDPDALVRVNSIDQGTPALPWSFYSNPLPWDVRLIHTSAHNGRETMTWTFVSPDHTNGSGYFVVWNDTRSERIGYLGTRGLTQTVPPPDQQFPAFGQSFDEMLRFPRESHISWIRDAVLSFSNFAGRSLFVISPARDRLFHIELMGNTVQTIWTGPPGSLRDVLLRPASAERVGAILEDGFEKIGPMKDRLTQQGAAMFLVLPDEIQQLDQRFQLVRRIRMPDELQNNRDSWQWAEPRPGEHVIVIDAGEWSQPRRKLQVLWFNDAGEVSQRREVWLQSGRPRTQVEREARLSVAATASPLVSIGLFLEATAELRQDANLGIVPMSAFTHFTDGVRQTFAVVWLPLVFVLLMSLGLVVASQRRLRRIGASRFDRVTWGALILLFGGAGYWAFLVHRRWPIHATCPACGHDGPRDRGECLACGAEFAAPARNGCELFA